MLEAGCGECATSVGYCLREKAFRSSGVHVESVTLYAPVWKLLGFALMVLRREVSKGFFSTEPPLTFVKNLGLFSALLSLGVGRAPDITG